MPRTELAILGSGKTALVQTLFESDVLPPHGRSLSAQDEWSTHGILTRWERCCVTWHDQAEKEPLQLCRCSTYSQGTASASHDHLGSGRERDDAEVYARSKRWLQGAAPVEP